MGPHLDPIETCTAERLEAVADLIEIAGRLTPSTAVVPGGHRVEDLRLVESARDHGIVDRIVLVGRKDRITRAVAEVGIDVPSGDIVPASGGLNPPLGSTRSRTAPCGISSRASTASSPSRR